MDELTYRREWLEGELAPAAPGSGRAGREGTTPGQVQAALPPDAALIDFLEYIRVRPPAGARAGGGRSDTWSSSWSAPTGPWPGWTWGGWSRSPPTSSGGGRRS